MEVSFIEKEDTEDHKGWGSADKVLSTEHVTFIVPIGHSRDEACIVSR